MVKIAELIRFAALISRKENRGARMWPSPVESDWGRSHGRLGTSAQTGANSMRKTPASVDTTASTSEGLWDLTAEAAARNSTSR